MNEIIMIHNFSINTMTKNQMEDYIKMEEEKYSLKEQNSSLKIMHYFVPNVIENGTGDYVEVVYSSIHGFNK